MQADSLLSEPPGKWQTQPRGSQNSCWTQGGLAAACRAVVFGTGEFRLHKNHSQLKSCAKIGSDWIWPASQVDPWPGPLSSHFPALTANCHTAILHCFDTVPPEGLPQPTPRTRLLPLRPLPNKNSGVVGFHPFHKFVYMSLHLHKVPSPVLRAIITNLCLTFAFVYLLVQTNLLRNSCGPGTVIRETRSLPSRC